MQANIYRSFIRTLSSLTPRQRHNLDVALGNYDQDRLQTLDKQLEAEFCEHPMCPHCQSEQVNKWGFSCGRQRFKCKSCDGTFNAFTDTPLARLRYPEKWSLYLEDMTQSMTLRPSAKHCDISLKAAFNWRHCFLSVMEDDMTDKLTGIVELDETLFRESFKGQKKDLPRPARRRGSQSTVDTRDIPVLIAKDRQGGIRDGILPDLSTSSLAACLEGHIDLQAPVCMDAFLSHESLAKKLGLIIKELVTSAGERVIDDIFHIQHVNAYQSHLKRWIEGIFHGVATRYLKHYLGWRRVLTEPVAITGERLQAKILGHWIKQH